MPEPQRLRGHDRDRRLGFSAPRQDVQDDGGGMDTVFECRGTSRLDGRQPIAQHRGQNLDHLQIANRVSGESPEARAALASVAARAGEAAMAREELTALQALSVSRYLSPSLIAQADRVRPVPFLP